MDENKARKLWFWWLEGNRGGSFPYDNETPEPPTGVYQSFTATFEKLRDGDDPDYCGYGNPNRVFEETHIGGSISREPVINTGGNSLESITPFAENIIIFKFNGLLPEQISGVFINGTRHGVLYYGLMDEESPQFTEFTVGFPGWPEDGQVLNMSFDTSQ